MNIPFSPRQPLAPAPRNLREYTAQVAAEDSSFFDGYIAARDRYKHLVRKAQGFAALLTSLQDATRSACTHFERTLDESSFMELLNLAGRAAAAKEVLAADPSLSMRLIMDHGSALALFQREFPDFRRDCVTMIETMLRRVDAEVGRVTPLEEGRLRLEVDTERDALGLDDSEARAPATSPLVLKLVAFRASLDRVLTSTKKNLGGGIYDSWFGDDVISTLDSILAHFQPAELPAPELVQEAA